MVEEEATASLSAAQETSRRLMLFPGKTGFHTSPTATPNWLGLEPSEVCGATRLTMVTCFILPLTTARMVVKNVTGPLRKEDSALHFE